MKPATNEKVRRLKGWALLGDSGGSTDSNILSLIARIEEQDVELKRLHEMEATVQQVLAADVEPLWPELVAAAKERRS